MTIEQDPINQDPIEQPKQTDVFAEISDAVGKNYSDKDAIIKALTEKDNFISRLQSENKETRELVDKLATKFDESMNAQKVLEELTARQKTQDAPPAQPLSEEELNKKLEQALTNHSRKTREEANISQVNKKLVELYGDKASEVFTSKVKELNLSVDKVKELAKESPEAALLLIGATGGKPIQAAPAPTSKSVDVPPTQRTEYQEFKERMKARGYKPTHPQYIMELNKLNIFN